jgi:hypothetical protein
MALGMMEATIEDFAIPPRKKTVINVACTTKVLP